MEQSDLISRKFEVYQISAINEFIDLGSTNILVVNECIQYDESSTHELSVLSYFPLCGDSNCNFCVIGEFVTYLLYN